VDRLVPCDLRPYRNGWISEDDYWEAENDTLMYGECHLRDTGRRVYSLPVYERMEPEYDLD